MYIYTYIFVCVSLNGKLQYRVSTDRIWLGIVSVPHIVYTYISIQILMYIFLH